MTAKESSLKMLETDGTAENGSGQEKLQGKRSGNTSAKRTFCCLLVTAACLAVVTVLPIALARRKSELISEYPVNATCPQTWIGFGNKCFYFSEETRNWTFSQIFCASLEAHLVQFETAEELNFLKRYKGPSDHWIGLRRESSHHIWKWTDNTEYHVWFVIKGGGECAYLNDNGVSSARVYTDRKWICSKPSNVCRCQVTSRSL
ncbi:C-type lectin domain family 2 member D11-like [Manis javanica]|uniref:C-type lectin domain family 2 member D11-like n=1 Tax=Manis javanica TaxID=9974 RepID=UPI0008137515|nr:C-type lectin domain family 2 member D11-like [Manis javanica]KAI5934107.1 C-type lectin domain family 2 member D [Manis javanica]